MKILVAHSAYQQPGGEDIVCRNEAQLLRQAGHEVREYLDDNRRIKELNNVVLLAGTIWSNSSHKKLRSILDQSRPDVAHFHNTFPLISPSVYYACHDSGIPVVQTLHNYRLLCPAASLYRDGHVCEECLHKSVKLPAVLHACYRDSRLATAAVSAMLAVHHSLGTWDRRVAHYIALSEFSRRKFVEGGLPAAKIAVKPNFVSPDPGARRRAGDYALYAGRLSAEKGPKLLLRAWKKGNLPVPLRIVGEGPLRAELEREKKALRFDNAIFDGRLERPLVMEIIKGARFLVLPSECYENFPLIIAEAYACGVPVIAPNLGAMAEIVRDGETGLHFEAGNAEDLANKVEWTWTHPAEMEDMGRGAREEFEAKYTAEQNLSMLLQIYERAIRGGARGITTRTEATTGQPERAADNSNGANPAFQVLGVRVDVVQIHDVIGRMQGWIRQGQGAHFIAVTGMHGVTEAQRDKQFKSVLNDADFVVPDGMPLVWCGRFRGHRLRRRVYGPELMLTFCQETATKGIRHFLYGGDAGVPEQLAASLERSCPGIRIVGTFSPPFRQMTLEEDAQIVEIIQRAAPEVLWVGLSTPKQEKWMREHRDRLHVPVLIGVGAAFDILAARKKQAPAWMREHGLEWFFRLLQEPQRLWKRYLVHGSQFIFLVALELLGVRRFD